MVKYYWLTWSVGLRCITVPNFIKIGQSLAYIMRFFNISKWQQSWISLGLIWTTCKEYMVVSVIVQNLVTIDVVVLKIWKFRYLARMAGKRLFTPKNCFFSPVILPHKWGASNMAVTPKGTSLHESVRVV